MENKSVIPDNWKGCNINDVSTKIHYGYTATANENGRGSKYLRITDIQDNNVNWNTVPFCEIDDKDIEKFELKENDIVFARTGGTVGKSFLIKNNVPFKAVFASYLIRIKLSNDVDQKFINMFFQSPNYWSQIELGKTGLKTNVNAQILSKLKLNLAPLPEQRVIVSKIEQLFSDLDNGIDNFKKAHEQLKIYRQAVLKNACEGKLVPTEVELARAEGRDYEPADVLLARILEERREKWNGKGKYKEPAALDTSKLPILPEGWGWVTSGTLSWFVTSGSRDWRKYYSSSGALFIRTQDINKNKLSLDNVAFVALPEKAEGKRSLVQKNDILIIITGANAGKVALVDTKISEAYVSQSVALIKLVMPDIARYLHFAMIADGFGKTELDKMVYGVGRPVLSLENVRDIILPLPPLAEQQRIVTEVERRLSVCDKMEATIAESLQKAESLRQSILKRAFEGKLLNEKELEEVRNAPDWEPAEKLLERIKAEKTNTKAKKKGKK